ncbi:MAG TPA: EMC3/TMCO1 family protein [Candidatus Acidoferrum sp.]|nr:EMC3/TMCO1 family protein [Candidatus Acidoferrum sp.]
MSLPQSIPFSTLFMLLLGALISFLTSLANRLLTDPEKSKAMRREVAEWSSQLRKAQKDDDKKTVEKLMKKQKQIMQLQTKMSWQQMKVTLIFLIPLFIIWQFLGAFYYGKPVAYFPGVGPDLPLPIFNTSLIWWYLLCSMFFGTIFTHLFGVIEVSE